MSVGFGLVVQRLERRRDRVLAVGHLVGIRSGDGWFAPGEVAAMFETLRLPRPGNISQELARLRDAELVMRRGSGGSWSLTPRGQEAVLELVGSIDAGAAEADILASGSAELAGGQHPLIPAELAPVRFLPAVRRLLAISPFERNVFCMTRFPRDLDPPGDPISDAIRVLRDELAENGLAMHLASDRNADDELFGNVVAHIWGCKYGVALLETRDQIVGGSRQLNDNVLIEIGAMLATGRRCALLKDINAPNLPIDFVAQIYNEIDISDMPAIKAAISGWARDDLGLRG